MLRVSYDIRHESKNRFTKGRKMIETMSSSFSVNAMANPPSRGMMSPARKLPSRLRLSSQIVDTEKCTPKIAWIPRRKNFSIEKD